MTEVENLGCGCGADCGREKFKRVTFNDSTIIMLDRLVKHDVRRRQNGMTFVTRRPAGPTVASSKV